jgi:hypothetical protein
MTDEADLDLLVLRRLLLVALDDIGSLPFDSPTRVAAIAGLQAALRRAARVAGQSRQAAAEGALMLERIVADHHGK